MRSYYNSTNSYVLATKEETGNNLRMLLFHPIYNSNEPELPIRQEFVIGSYFQQTPAENGIIDYSWDWGHYFNNIESAMNYWLNAENDKPLPHQDFPKHIGKLELIRDFLEENQQYGDDWQDEINVIEDTIRFFAGQ